MWFLTIYPFVGIPVFIAKLSERQHCWRVLEDFRQEYIQFFDTHNCLFLRLHSSIGGHDYCRTTRLRQSIHFSFTQILFADHVHLRTRIDNKHSFLKFHFPEWEKEKRASPLTHGNRTAHAYHASLRTVFIEGTSPSAPDATGPSRREQPKDQAAAQSNRAALPPAKPGSTLLPDFSRRRWSQQSSGLRPRRPRPPNWHGHARQSTLGKSFLFFAWRGPKTSRQWSQSPAERWVRLWVNAGLLHRRHGDGNRRRHRSGLRPEQGCLVIGKRWEGGVLAESGIHHPSRLTLPPVLGLSGVNLLLIKK